MRYTNWTETKSLEVLKSKGSLFLKSRDRILKETIILVLVKFGLPWIFYKGKLSECDRIWDRTFLAVKEQI